MFNQKERKKLMDEVTFLQTSIVILLLANVGVISYIYVTYKQIKQLEKPKRKL